MSRTEHALIQKRFSSRKWFVGALIAIACLQLFLMFLFGTLKAGLFIDEYFTFTLSNSETGLSISSPANAWMSPKDLENQLAVSPFIPTGANGAFHYERVIANNAADVHPPMYYFLIHTLSSVFPGWFSKWIGILVNAPFLLGCLALIAAIAWHFTRDRLFTLVAAVVYACNPSTLTNATLIRMYCMLSFFVLLALWLHLRLLSGRLRFGIFLPACCVTYFIGFMTHYHFIVLCGLLSGCCFVFFLFRKLWVRAGLYAAGLLATLFATYLFYPAWVEHLFSGYRGTEAIENLKADNFFQRLSDFTSIVNERFFSKGLPLLLGLLLVLGAAAFWRARKCGLRALFFAFWRTRLRAQALMVSGIVCAAFLFLAKTSVWAGPEFSTRYLLYVAGPFVLLAALGIYTLLRHISPLRNAAALCVLVLFTALNLFGLTVGNEVCFLFKEDRQLIAEAAANRDLPVLILQDNHLFIGMATQLFEYRQIYFVPADNPQPIADDTLLNAQTVLCYIDRLDPIPKHWSTYLRENFPKLTTIERLNSPSYHFYLYKLTP